MPENKLSFIEERVKLFQELMGFTDITNIGKLPSLTNFLRTSLELQRERIVERIEKERLAKHLIEDDNSYDGSKARCFNSGINKAIEVTKSI